MQIFFTTSLNCLMGRANIYEIDRNQMLFNVVEGFSQGKRNSPKLYAEKQGHTNTGTIIKITNVGDGSHVYKRVCKSGILGVKLYSRRMSCDHAVEYFNQDNKSSFVMTCSGEEIQSP